MAAPTMAPVSRIQSRNCVKATSAIPMILPNISSVAFTELMRTSTTLLDFSSMTADITIAPNIVMKMKMKMPSTILKMEFTLASLIFSLPASSRV